MPYRVEYREGSRRPFGPTRPGRVVGYYSGKVHNRIIPRVAHQRLVAIPPPSRYYQTQDPFFDGSRYSLIPIPYNVKVRVPSYTSKVVRIEDLDSGSELDEFEAETRCIRRDANHLLMAYGYPAPLYAVHNIPLRNAGEAKQVVDIRRKWVRERNHMGPMSRIHSEIYRMAMYQEPMRKPIGRGRGTNLACISYAGGRPISKRQLRFYPEDDKIREDVSFRAFYNSLRVAATLGMMYKKPLYQPLYRSKKSLMGSIEPEHKERKESKWVQRAFSSEPITKREERPIRKLAEEIREDVILPSPRKSIVELERQPTFEEHVQEEPIVVKMPRKSIVEPEPVEEPEVVEEEVVLAATQPEEEAEVEPEPEPEPEPVEDPPKEEEKVVEPELEPEPVREEKVEEEPIPTEEEKEEIEPTPEETEFQETIEDTPAEPEPTEDAFEDAKEEPAPEVSEELVAEADEEIKEAEVAPEEASMVNGTVEEEEPEIIETKHIEEPEEVVVKDAEEEEPLDNHLSGTNEDEEVIQNDNAEEIEADKAQEEEDLEPEPEPEPEVEDLPDESQEEAITSPPPPEPSPVPIKSEEEEEEEETE